MQEFHSIEGVNHHQHLNHALKCPRCDSFNTKFCYYNNYNLSQPRHFCKNCRRYWTKGGVLRNVPVGGGSRKSKHSKNSKAVSSSSSTASSPPGADEHKSNSESSTFTAAATEAISNTPISNATVTPRSKNDAFLFGNNIIDASSFGFGFNHQHQQQHGNDQVHVAQQQNSHQRLSLLHQQQLSNGFGSLDWEASAGNCLFDVPNTVDQSYWTHSHWSDHHVNHSSLFHLP
ncbi:unnamed protein product [Lathyrus oleraceus]|nr:dof zinc finger protein DOF5.4-like [Pisum sativum]